MQQYRRLQTDPDLYWTISVLLSCCLQAHILQLLQNSQPQFSMLFLFVQCAAPLLAISSPPKVEGQKQQNAAAISRTRASLQAILYTVSLVLPRLAIYWASDIGSVAITTVFSSSDILWNLIMRRDRSVLRWYGGSFICFGLLYLTAALEWPPSMLSTTRSLDNYAADSFQIVLQINNQAWRRLTAVTFICVGIAANTFLGIERERHGRDDHEPYLFATFALIPSAVVASLLYVTKCSWDDVFLLCLYAVASAFAAVAIKNYQQCTLNDSYKLSYLLTVRRFITIALGSFLYTSSQRYVVLLSAVLVAFGVGIVELHFAAERAKQRRLMRETTTTANNNNASTTTTLKEKQK